MFLHVSVILFTWEGWYPSMPCSRSGGWYPSMHCRWYPSMPCSRCPEGSPGPHPGGSPGPHPVGGVLQAHTHRGIPACTEADTPPGRLLLRMVRILLECIFRPDSYASGLFVNLSIFTIYHFFKKNCLINCRYFNY